MLIFLPRLGSVMNDKSSTRGANDASRVRVQLNSSRVVNISSRAYSSSSRAYSSRVLIESSPSSSRVISFH